MSSYVVTLSNGDRVIAEASSLAEASEACTPDPSSGNSVESVDILEAEFRVDVTDDGRTWASNGRRFASTDDAKNYAYDLSSRWMAVKAARVVPSDVEERGAVDPDDPRIVVNYL